MAENISRRSILGASAALLGCAISQPVHANTPRPRFLTTDAGRRVDFWEWPAKGKAKATIIFSHGAASAPRHYERLFRPWAEAGYKVLAPLHVDSTDHPQTAEYPGLSSWKARIEDMRLLSSTLGDKSYIAAGHSYGGLTAIAMGGGVSLIPDGISGALHDLRAMGVLALSPPAAIAPLVGAAGYAPIAVPSFHQTGTKDILPGAAHADDWKGHLDAFNAAHAEGHHYGLVLRDVDHYFGGLICKPDAGGHPQEAELNYAVALSIEFMDGIASQSPAKLRRLARRTISEGQVGLFHK